MDRLTHGRQLFNDSETQVYYNRLKQYEDLEEQGLLVKLPCKLGDTIWNNDYGKPCSFTVTGFSITSNNYNEIVIHYKNTNGSITEFCSISYIGKTVFLTQEQAKKAMN